MQSKPLKLIVSILLPLLTGGIAGLFTAQSVTGWYQTLTPPSFNPPNWIFGPVWTSLYILMGVAFYLIWTSAPSAEKGLAMRIYFVQLLLNFLWSFLFFYFENIRLALIEIVVLWAGILWMISTFRRINPTAAYLNVPYLLWVSFATVLNGAYVLLN